MKTKEKLTKGSFIKEFTRLVGLTPHDKADRKLIINSFVSLLDLLLQAERERCVNKIIREGEIAFANTDDDVQIEWIKAIVDLSVKAIRED
ncbi:hypothetical protein LCGC14_0365180 [marine sediment metagenome]|uniref:Uncharacterized protein n=1 Tax=marine sediment metagenome TaxID=412755 RepID=A0A0F9VU82_9ZZZZ